MSFKGGVAQQMTPQRLHKSSQTLQAMSEEVQGTYLESFIQIDH